MKYLRTLTLQAALFSLLTPALWWLLPCPHDPVANLLVTAVALYTAAAWFWVALACLTLALDEFGTQFKGFIRRVAWDGVECLCAPGEYFRRKQLEDFNRVVRDVREGVL